MNKLKKSKCKRSWTSLESWPCCLQWWPLNRFASKKNVRPNSKPVTKPAKTNLLPAPFNVPSGVKDVCKTASLAASRPSIFCTAALTNVSTFDLCFIYFTYLSIFTINFDTWIFYLIWKGSKVLGISNFFTQGVTNFYHSKSLSVRKIKVWMLDKFKLIETFVTSHHI